MKLETILDAFEKTVLEQAWWDDKDTRQYLAFCDRILRMFEVGKAINADLVMEIEMRDARIAELEEELADE